ncbi:histidine phosphatase family protein [Leptospira fluminis]|uniref:Histidine phosphatase family protein n=1 Tax=Leptospira fluminis TaxID=2484979 RepID=A0A4R9GLR2_9LEPT|nr:histidine phosphatase family protein [Leptospira fluminis]TGK15565.1 histidine phosphatase family protein [Leptospira fluminis]
MSVVYLIRHGQANSRGEDYDLLTDHGKKQSFLLGKYMGENGDIPDRIVTGSLRRHKETAESFLDGLRSVDRRLLKAREEESLVLRDSGWNEFSPELWSAYAKILSEKNPDFHRSLSQFAKVKLQGGIRSAALFFKLTEEILVAWRRGEETPPGIESYSDFECRVSESCERWFSPSDKERTFVFTSGTPISLVLKKILRQDTGSFDWMPWIWNTSLSTFRWVRGRYLPVSVNNVPHLPEKPDRTLF